MSPIRTLATPRPPKVVRLPWREAHELAAERLEPLFVPCDQYCDDRGWSLMNLLDGAMSREGQINYSVQYPGIVKAWHRHDLQTDFWCVLRGHLKAGVFREEDGAMWSIVFGEKRPGVLVIPPPLWHGAATVGSSEASLLYYVTKAFDPENPDEHRRPWDSVDGFSWAAEHR